MKRLRHSFAFHKTTADTTLMIFGLGFKILIVRTREWNSVDDSVFLMRPKRRKSELYWLGYRTWARVRPDFVLVRGNCVISSRCCDSCLCRRIFSRILLDCSRRTRPVARLSKTLEVVSAWSRNSFGLWVLSAMAEKSDSPKDKKDKPAVCIWSAACFEFPSFLFWAWIAQLGQYLRPPKLNPCRTDLYRLSIALSIFCLSIV